MKKRRGFSLVELMFALTIAAACCTLLLTLLASGTNAARETHQRAVAARVAENLRARLLADPDFPVPQTQSLAYPYATNIYYDADGNETTSADSPLRATLEFFDPAQAHYASRRLDSIAIQIYEAQQPQPLAVLNFQRAHPRPRP